MLIINVRIGKLDELQSLFTVKTVRLEAGKVNIVSKKRIISLKRLVNKLLPLEVVDEKKGEVPTFIDQECSGTECRGNVT